MAHKSEVSLFLAFIAYNKRDILAKIHISEIQKITASPSLAGGSR